MAPRWWLRLRGELAALLHEPPTGPVPARTRQLLAGSDASPRPEGGPIFVTGRFRSGSTLLWNLFRQAGGYTAYYEPFNELFGQAVDPTHRRVSDYWAEYEAVPEARALYDPAWSTQGLLMGPEAEAPAMRRYLNALIEGASERPVLQFNRVDFRLPWLRATFPEALLLHIHRDPRDQWVSSLGGLELPPDAATAEMIPLDPYYLWRWVVDLQPHFPFLDHRRAEHAYELFYLLWKLSGLFGRRFAHHSIGFEALVDEPARELAALGLEDPRLLELIQPPAPDRWRSYADEAWFSAHEGRCEQILADALRA